MNRILLRMLSLLLLFNLQLGFSQDGELDLSFNPPVYLDYPSYNGSYNGRIYATKILNDGKILIYGDIDEYLGQEVNKLFRIFPDGQLVTSFDVGTGPDTHIIFIDQNSNAICVQDDGKILVGGSFNSFNNVARKNVVRLHTDGSVDLTFNPGTGSFDGMILAIATQADGKILCGGIFNEFNGPNRNNLVRLNANGTIDNTFNTGTGFNYTITGSPQSSYVKAIEVLSDNTILVGGFFNRYKGVLQKGLIRLDSNGAKDNTFLIGTGTNQNDVVRQIYVNPADQKIYLAGSIANFNGTATSNLMRLNADGTSDTAFNVTQNVGTNNFNSGISDFGVLSSGNIIVSGNFAINESQDLAMYNNTGNLIEDFQFQNVQSINTPEVYSVSVANDDAIYVAGYFKNINQMYNSKGSIVKIQPDGETDLSFNPNLGTIGNNYIARCFQLTDGTLLLSCRDQYNERKLNSMIKIHPNGAIVEDDYANFKVLPRYSQQFRYNNAGELFILTSAGVYKLHENGLIDNSFTTTQGMVPNINTFKRTIAIQSDDKIIIGGNFRLNSNTQYRQRIFRVTNTGAVDNSFNVGKGFNGNAISNYEYVVNCLEVQSDDKILVGGEFNNFDDNVCNNFTRLNADGTLDQPFNSNLGAGFNHEVRNILAEDDGKIIVAGLFTTLNNNIAHYIVRLNPNGTVDPTFNSPFVQAVEFDRVTKVKNAGDGKYIIAAVMGGVQKLLRLNNNGSIDTAFFTDNDFLEIDFADNNINHVDLILDIEILDNSKILVVGSFFKVNNITRYGFALFNATDGLSVDDLHGTSIGNAFVAPNPVEDFLVIKSSDRYNKAAIFDVSGKWITTELLTDNSCNLGHLKPGLYIVKLDHYDKGIKFIKK